MNRHAFALLFSAFLATLLNTGCSQVLTEEVTPEAAPVRPPPMLTFEAPLHQQPLALADDLDGATEGMQTDIVVRVRDLEHGVALEDIEIGIAGAWVTVPLIEHAGGRFAIIERATLTPTENPHMALVEARVFLDDEERPAAEARVRPRLPDVAADPCTRRLTVAGDVTVQSPAELPQGAGCLMVQGDLVIDGTDLIDLDGFNAVVEVGGSVVVENNPSLVDLDPWDTLERIGGDLVIVENPALTAEEVSRLIDRVGIEDIGGDIVVDLMMD